jgi:Sulfite exporter TauE/SafE
MLASWSELCSSKTAEPGPHRWPRVVGRGATLQILATALANRRQMTAVYVYLFGFTFLQSVATTKVINAFSSLVATLVFAAHGVVEDKLGTVLGATMFLGAVVGADVAIRLFSRLDSTYLSPHRRYTCGEDVADQSGIVPSRSLSNTFAGIRSVDVPLFWVAQVAAGLVARFIFQLFKAA